MNRWYGDQYGAVRMPFRPSVRSGVLSGKTPLSTARYPNLMSRIRQAASARQGSSLVPPLAPGSSGWEGLSPQWAASPYAAPEYVPESPEYQEPVEIPEEFFDDLSEQALYDIGLGGSQVPLEEMEEFGFFSPERLKRDKVETNGVPHKGAELAAAGYGSMQTMDPSHGRRLPILASHARAMGSSQRGPDERARERRGIIDRFGLEVPRPEILPSSYRTPVVDTRPDMSFESSLKMGAGIAVGFLAVGGIAALLGHAFSGR